MAPSRLRIFKCDPMCMRSLSSDINDRSCSWSPMSIDAKHYINTQLITSIIQAITATTSQRHKYLYCFSHKFGWCVQFCHKWRMQIFSSLLPPTDTMSADWRHNLANNSLTGCKGCDVLTLFNFRRGMSEVAHSQATLTNRLRSVWCISVH